MKKTMRSLLVLAMLMALVFAFGTNAMAAEPNYLTFTAQEDNSSITFNWRYGDSVEYSTDGETWNSYVANTKISLNKNEYVKFKGEGIITGDGGDQFTMSGKIAGSGDVTSLTNGSGGDAALTEYCYKSMFYNCGSLVTAPNLPSTTLAKGCYEFMFCGCSALTNAPVLSVKTMANGCYCGMFCRCTALKTAPVLPATTLAEECYAGMFKDCTSLETAPALPATTLSEKCYSEMFLGCTALTAAPVLPATTLAEECYSEMFIGCTALTAAPALPATVLADYCYKCMFSGCTALETAPELKATGLKSDCYQEMFYGCTSLKTAPSLPATTLVEGCYCYMFEGCTALETAPELKATTLAKDCYEGMFKDCTSLKTAPDLKVTTLADCCYQGMFSGCKSLTAAPDLKATTLEDSCYSYMFSGCKSLTAAPELKATTLAEDCCKSMFEDCTSLKTAPDLKATTLADCCYQGMFSGCKSLTAAPALPATTLVEGCYCYMFEDCTSLKTAPELKATTLADYCYESMFENCKSLLTVQAELPAGELTVSCYEYMFSGCKSLTAAPALPATTLAEDCYYGMFAGCENLTKAPALPATTLAEACYCGMFADCTALTEAPQLPATDLTDAVNCYCYMFSGCTSLTVAPDLPATTLEVACYYEMFEGCTGLKIVAAQSGECTEPWSIPALAEADYWNEDMFCGATGVDLDGEGSKEPECLNTTYYQQGGNYLTFTAVAAGSVKLIANDPEDTVVLNAELQYRVDDGTWQDYTLGDEISLAKDKKAAFKAKTENTSFSKNSDNYYQFVMTGEIAASGSVTSLLDGKGMHVALSAYCFKDLFKDCAALTSAPQLLSSTLAEGCYYGMFRNCVGLTQVPKLTATELAESCYREMFYGCTGLKLKAVPLDDCTESWVIPAAAEKANWNTDMFNGVTGVDFGDGAKVPAYGKFYYQYNGMGVPHYLTFTAEAADSVVSFDGDADEIEYSTDGILWEDYDNEDGEEIILSEVGDYVMFRGKNVSTSEYEKFYIEGKVAGSGHVTSLTNGFGGDVELSYDCYDCMFYECTGLTSAPELPSTTLADYCYYYMFSSCSNLTEAPALPATTLADYCYYCMFYDCENLETAPALQATDLAEGCYCYMFYGCENLETAPTLPVTDLTDADYCYYGMFGNCSSLTEAPALPATTLSEECYENMFYGCENLETAPALPAASLTDGCYYGMFCYCSSLTEAPALPATTLAEGCFEYMFYGCTALTEVPDLPVETLADSCYYGMFGNCSSLTEAPALPATTLAEGCYEHMFYNCEKLESAPVLNATTLADSCYYGMFENCVSLKSIPDLPATTMADDCYAGMFYGCTGLKISTTQTTDCTKAWSLPSGLVTTDAEEWDDEMFGETADTVDFGSGSKYPVAGTTYYQPQGYSNFEGISVTDYNQVYDGEAHTVTVTGIPEGAAVKYGTEYNKYNLTECPTFTAATDGAQTVYFKVTKEGYNSFKGTGTVTITKASITPAVSLADWEYGENQNIHIVTGNTGDGAVTYTYKTKGADDNTYADAVPTAIGAYTVKAVIEETANYQGGTATADFNITKITITPEVSLADWVYGETPNTPNVTGNTGDGTVTYTYKVKGAEDTTYGTEIPTVAGEYTVKAVIEETANYKSGTATADFTVLAERIAITPEVSLADWVYGETPNTPIVTGNTGDGAVTYTYKVKGAEDTTYGTEVPTVAGEYTVKAEIAQTAVYQSGTATADFEISKASGAAAPTGLSGVSPSTATANDGKITGTTPVMEYSENTNFVPAMDCTANETAGLAAGTYYVRIKETANVKAGSYCTVEVPFVEAYTIDIGESASDEVSFSDEAAYPGQKVTVTVTQKVGYNFEKLIVTDEDGNEIEVAVEKTGESYSFTMPASGVKVETVYEKDASQIDFIDVTENDYFYDAVAWAIGKGVVLGVDETHFAPKQTATRGQVMTFLWRAAGCPEPAVGNNPFTDVTNSKAYYYKAVLWAVENGITSGTTDTTFSPDNDCTRAQVVTFLYRYDGEQEVGDVTNPFTDVKAGDYYYNAVLWAVENGVTSGTSKTTFSPNKVCKRCEGVTFLYRYCK